MNKNKYWIPIKQNLEYIESLIKEDANVLEIGPGTLPFSKATEFCGWTNEEKSRINKYKTVDVSSEILPYKNNEFDFVYCRHVIEDLWNPVHALKEISRIAKAGYIETPSALCELSKDVDAGTNVAWRGYNHHRYIIWNDNGVLNIIPKFPIIEHMKFNDEFLEKHLEDPFLWSTYFHFQNEINFKFYEMGREKDFVLFNNSYTLTLRNAIQKSINEANEYKRKIL